MAQTIEINGETYEDVPSIQVPLTTSGMASFYDVSDTTAIASDVASGKYFYTANGVKTAGSATIGGVTVVESEDQQHGGTIVSITGQTISLQEKTVNPAYSSQIILPDSGYTGLAKVTVNTMPPLKYGVIRPDAELVKTYSYDKYIHEDEKVTIPSYTTTSTILKDTEAFSETYTIDQNTYDYYALIRMLTIPSYSVSTKGKGRVEYWIGSYLYEWTEIEANNFVTLIDSSKKYTSRTTSTNTSGSYYRLFYWSSTTAVTVYTSAAYGVAQTVVAPTLSSGVITFNKPKLIIRGHTTYFTSTYFNALTDIRYQYVIELYRAPKNNLNINGWGSKQNALHILDCVNNNNCKLT